MKDLITITNSTIGKEEINAVDARELWVFLGSKIRFNDWIKRRIEKYEFVQGADFITMLKNEYSPLRKDYIISIDMAKELSMVENTEKGRYARKYFIQCENDLKALTPALPQTYLEALKALTESVEKSEQLKIENAEQSVKIIEDTPKVIFADSVAASKTSILIGAMAKLINQNGVSMGQNRLFKWMREHGYIMNRNGSKREPTQRSLDLGVLEKKEGTYIKPGGMIIITSTTVVTGKGQIYFMKKLVP